MRVLIFILFLIPSLAIVAHAYESEEVQGYSDLEPSEVISLSPDTAPSIDESRMNKFLKVLKLMNIPAEPAPNFSDFPAPTESSFTEISPLLDHIDYGKNLRNYFKIEETGISLFQDFNPSLLASVFRALGKTASFPLEYHQSFKPSGYSTDSISLVNKIQSVATQVQQAHALPLSGLKVLIDPGHMGSDEWDLKTGKFVAKNGMRVSEGAINLWTALLVAKELEELGATVKLTRTQLGTVSRFTPATYDYASYVRQAFYDSLDGWMAPYLNKSNSEIARLVPKTPSARKLLSETDSSRLELFISGEDLEARSDLIDAFHPDLTLDIHYDALSSDQTQSSTNELEAFVPGAFFAKETGSRLNRALALKHLVEPNRWNESVNIASEITQAMSKELRVPTMKSPALGGAIKIKDGVYARNLHISRRARSGLLVYLECLHYDYVAPPKGEMASEFYLLARHDAKDEYHGKYFSYPRRLNTVASGIRAGILNYFRNFPLH